MASRRRARLNIKPNVKPVSSKPAPLDGIIETEKIPSLVESTVLPTTPLPQEASDTESISLERQLSGNAEIEEREKGKENVDVATPETTVLCEQTEAKIVVSQPASLRKISESDVTEVSILDSSNKELQPVQKRQVRKLVVLDEPVNRSKMTMRELIYKNPSANPMKATQEEKRLKAAARRCSGSTTGAETVDAASPPVSPPPLPPPKSEREAVEDLAVPQVKVGADGQIILNEESLTLRPAEEPTGLVDGEAAYEMGDDFFNGYAKRNRGQTWNTLETKKFFVALSTIGTDFSLMTSLFPKRSRTELKRKFKREEKFNKVLVEKCFVERHNFDLKIFEDLKELEDEEQRQKTKKPPTRRRKAPKEDAPKGTKRKKKKRGLLYKGSDEDDTEDEVADVPEMPVLEPQLPAQSKQQPENLQEFPTFTRLRTPSPPARPPARRKKQQQQLFASDSEEDAILDQEVTNNVIKGPTRSGRIPRAAMRFGEAAPDEEDDEEEEEEEKVEETDVAPPAVPEMAVSMTVEVEADFPVAPPADANDVFVPPSARTLHSPIPSPPQPPMDQSEAAIPASQSECSNESECKDRSQTLTDSTESIGKTFTSRKKRFMPNIRNKK